MKQYFQQDSLTHEPLNPEAKKDILNIYYP
jgi:hypothetical protein